MTKMNMQTAGKLQKENFLMQNSQIKNQPQQELIVSQANVKINRQEVSPVHIHYHNHHYIKVVNKSPTNSSQINRVS